MSQQPILVRKRSYGLANLGGRGYTCDAWPWSEALVEPVNRYCTGSTRHTAWRGLPSYEKLGTIALVWTTDRSQGSAFWQATAPIYDGSWWQAVAISGLV
jgi:hypothetical protein